MNPQDQEPQALPELPEPINGGSRGFAPLWSPLFTADQMLAFRAEGIAISLATRTPLPVKVLSKVKRYYVDGTRKGTMVECAGAGWVWIGDVEMALEKALATQEPQRAEPAVSVVDLSRRWNELQDTDAMELREKADAAGVLNMGIDSWRSWEWFCEGAKFATRKDVSPPSVPATESYVQRVPDQCDRIVWRNYYHLPIAPAAPPSAPASETALEAIERLSRQMDEGIKQLASGDLGDVDPELLIHAQAALYRLGRSAPAGPLSDDARPVFWPGDKVIYTNDHGAMCGATVKKSETRWSKDKKPYVYLRILCAGDETPTVVPQNRVQAAALAKQGGAS